VTVAVLNEVLERRQRERWSVLAQYALFDLVRAARLVWSGLLELAGLVPEGELEDGALAAASEAVLADEILGNLNDDELDPDDILIVLPDAIRAKARAPRIIRLLAQRGVRAHLVGVNSSVDEVFMPGSVAIAQIYRAKGNEAPMVYSVDAQYGAQSFNAVTRRNTLFTAITRSRAWVRVTGWGEQAAVIASEINEVKERQYKLDFTIPTPEQLATLRHLHRDRPAEAEAVIKKTTDVLTTFLEAPERGEVDMADLPPAIRTRLAARVQQELVDES